MKPFTDYEVMIVSFKGELTSKPKVMQKFTSTTIFLLVICFNLIITYMLNIGMLKHVL